MNSFRISYTQRFGGLLERLFDATTIGLSLLVSIWLVGHSFTHSSLLAIAIAIGCFLIVGELLGVYRSDQTRSANDDFRLVVSGWLLTVLILAVLVFFARQSDAFSRASVLGWIFLTGAMLGLQRMLVRIACECFFATGLGSRRCAIAGLNDLGRQLLNNARHNPQLGLKIMGFFDDRSPKRQDADEQCKLLGNLELLVDQARRGEIDTVFVTMPMRAEARIRWLLERLADTTASTYIVPDFFVFELLHSRWNSIGGLPAVSVFETPMYGVDGWLKRIFDVAAATFGLLILAPAMLLCAALIKLSSPGPIFFRQRRYGLDGKEILVWKFRSMRTCDNGPTIVQATKDDPRITPIGRILRRTSLDELPQLFNVLDGSMSLVGPRPHATAHNEYYRKLIRGYMLRHKVKPGITGLAQVEGYRGETDTLDKMQKRVEFDHKYIQQWSVWLDIRIVLRTLFVVLKQENAY
jgi:putative colanic acid biosysnthesis UDP-glucose lipid carrier transferase